MRNHETCGEREGEESNPKASLRQRRYGSGLPYSACRGRCGNPPFREYGEAVSERAVRQSFTYRAANGVCGNRSIGICHGDMLYRFLPQLEGNE